MTSIFFSFATKTNSVYVVFDKQGGGGATPGENGKAAHPVCSAFLTDHNSNCLVLTGLDKKKKKSRDRVKT